MVCDLAAGATPLCVLPDGPRVGPDNPRRHKIVFFAENLKLTFREGPYQGEEFLGSPRVAKPLGAFLDNVETNRDGE
jgi:hypothetical protein